MTTSEAKNFIEKIAESNKEWLRNENSRGAIDILKRLNSQDTHFILELIQNADDALKGAEKNPQKVSFELNGSELTVRNWGKPFQEADVEALSKVGQSNKKNKEDQIGHFGIGFKSVFRASPQPKIFSGGFSFAYDEETYIVPKWLDEPTPDSKGAFATFVLRLKDDVRLIEAIQKQLEQIQSDPRILLFLRRTRCIEVNGRILKRDGTDKNTTLQIVGSDQTNWRVYHAKVPLTPDMREELRKLRGDYAAKKENEQISIAVAVKLTQDGQRIDTKRKGKVFAFLPTNHEWECPFDLQADFEVNAERTRLKDPVTCNWNRWLLGQISHVFDLIFDDVKKGDFPISCFYGLMPNQKDRYNADATTRQLLDVIKPELDRWFTSRERVWTSEEKWCTCDQSLLADKEWVELVSDFQGLGESNAHLNFVSNEIQDRGKNFLRECKVPELANSHVLSALRQLQGLNRPLDWHIRLVIRLGSLAAPFWSEIKTCLILPTTSGELAASKGDTFRTFRLPTGETAVTLELFKGKCRFLDPALQKYFEAEQNGKPFDSSKWNGRKLLNELAPEMTPRKLYDEFILPLFLGNPWNDEDHILRCTKFCKDHSLTDSPLKLKTLSGGFADPKSLYMTSAYDSSCHFEHLVEAKECLVSRCYLLLDNDIDGWRKFFSELHVRTGPKIVEQKTNNISVKLLTEKLRREPRKSHRNFYSEVDKKLDPELARCFDETDALRHDEVFHRAQIFTKLLDGKWDSLEQEKSLVSEYEYQPNQSPRYEREKLETSSFAIWLQMAKWIPTKSGKLSSTSELCECEEILAVELKNEAFRKFLYKKERNASFLCDQLKQLVKVKNENINSYREIYDRLFRICRTNEDELQKISDRLGNSLVIFLPGQKPHWFRASDVAWKCRKLPLPALNREYKDKKCKEWFISLFRVADEPTPNHLVTYSEQNIWNKPLDDSSLSQWQTILSMLEEALEDDAEIFSNPDPVSWLRQQLKFFCLDGNWVSAKETMYYVDPGSEGALPRESRRMNIVKQLMPEPIDLYKKLKILPLSKKLAEAKTVPAKLETESNQEMPTEFLITNVKEMDTFGAEPSSALSPTQRPSAGYPRKKSHSVAGERLATPLPEIVPIKVALANFREWVDGDEAVASSHGSIRSGLGRSENYMNDEERLSIGKWSEEIVFLKEKESLMKNGRADLAGKVVWKSKENPAHPFDIFSFESDGVPIEIEVKGSTWSSGDPAIISKNEWEYAQQNAEKHRLYIVYCAQTAAPVIRCLKFGQWEVKPKTFSIITKRTEARPND